VKLTLLINIAFNRLNNAPESSPRTIRRNIGVPTICVKTSQRARLGDTPDKLCTFAALALQGVTCPPLFPNCRDSIQSIHIWLNLIETLRNLGNGGVPPRIQFEFRRRLDLDKQQGALAMLDDEIDREVVGISRVWDGPVGTDVVAFFRREPVV